MCLDLKLPNQADICPLQHPHSNSERKSVLAKLLGSTFSHLLSWLTVSFDLLKYFHLKKYSGKQASACFPGTFNFINIGVKKVNLQFLQKKFLLRSMPFQTNKQTKIPAILRHWNIKKWTKHLLGLCVLPYYPQHRKSIHERNIS